MAKGLAHDILVNVKEVADAVGEWPSRNQYRVHPKAKYNKEQITATFGSWTQMVLAAGKQKVLEQIDEGDGPKIYLIDIETAPMEVYVYEPWDQNIRHNQVINDWSILSFAAMNYSTGEMIYRDLRDHSDPRDDTPLLEELWNILDAADILITQNGKKFDVKKINARLIHKRIRRRQPYSTFKHVDTKIIAKRYFGFTYNSLEYLCEHFDVKHKKLKHDKFPGMELQKECLKGNPDAWREMEEYNRQDILALRDVWEAMRAWDATVNTNLYIGTRNANCRQPGCSGEYLRNGFYFSAAGKYQRYRCDACGNEARGRENLLSKRKKDSLKHGTTR